MGKLTSIIVLTLAVAAFSSATFAQTTQPEATPVIPATAATRPASVSFDELLAGVKKSETQFTNVYVKDFETTEEILPKGEKEWKPTPEAYAGSAWFEGSPRGKRRVFFSSQILRWVQGSAPYAESSIDDGWDGKEGREVRVSFKNGNKRATPTNIAQIFNQAPMMIDTPYLYFETGVGFTAQYWVDRLHDGVTPPQPRQSLSDYLKNFKGPRTNLVDQQVNGFDAVRLAAGDLNAGGPNAAVPSGFEAFWFVPSRGFALVKFENAFTLPNESHMEGFDVLDLKEVASGIWFPMQAQTTRQGVFINDQMDPGYTRLDYTALNVVVNNPKFDESIFKIKIPPGYIVSDDTAATRHSYIVTDDGSTQDIVPHTPIPRVKLQPATRPDGE